MQIGLIYTGFNTTLQQIVEESIQRELSECGITFATYANPGIIEECLQHNGVTAKAAAMQLSNYMHAIYSGADILYNVCSTLGDVAEKAKPICALMGVPLIRIDERMVEHVVANARSIALIAANETILQPSRALFELVMERRSAKLHITEVILEPSDAPMEERIYMQASLISSSVDMIVLTQASLAGITDSLCERLGKPVLSSSPFGAHDLAEAIHQLSQERREHT